MRRFDLPTMNDKAKSFYNKAIVIEKDNGDIELQSYTTIVCRIKSSHKFNLPSVIHWVSYAGSLIAI